MEHMKLMQIIKSLFSKYFSIQEIKPKYQSRKGRFFHIEETHGFEMRL